MEYMYQLQYILFSKKITIYIFSNRKGFFLLLSEGPYIFIYIYNTIKQINMINSILGAFVHLKALDHCLNGLLTFEQPLPACYGVNTIPILNLVEPRAKPANQITYKEHV